MSFGPLAAVHLVWLLWGASWIVAARWHARTVGRETQARTLPPLAVAALGFLGMFAEPPGRLHPLWRPPAVAAWGMVALAALAVSLAWWARLHLGALWAGGIVRREGHRVVDTGPYARVRHPIYTAVIAASAALAAVKATPLSLAGAALVALGFAWKARIEERFLADQLGHAAYDAYRRRVPMLLPRV